MSDKPMPSDFRHPDAPDAEAVIIRGWKVYQWFVPCCPLCGLTHWHGGGPISAGKDEPYRNLGHRHAHCDAFGKNIPGYDNGYNIVPANRLLAAAQVQRAPRTEPRFARTTCPSCGAAQRVHLLDEGTIHEATRALRGHHHDCTECGARLILALRREVL